jgi:transcription antitermination factor NusG
VTEISGALTKLAISEANTVIRSSGDAARYDPAWFAIQTWPRYEKKVATELERKEVVVFLPLLKNKHKWSDRTRLVELPLFPHYVFVNIQQTLDARVPVLRTNGVTSFVGVRGLGTPVPDSEIESVRTMLDRGISFQAHPFLSIGQRVRILSGSLRGVEGVLTGKANDDPSLVVSIQIIQRSVAIRLSGYQIVAA